MVDLAELRRLAEAVTKGEWGQVPDTGGVVERPYGLIIDCWPTFRNDDAGCRRAAYIVAAQPANILALLDRLERAEKALADLEAAASEAVTEDVIGAVYERLHHVASYYDIRAAILAVAPAIFAAGERRGLERAANASEWLLVGSNHLAHVLTGMLGADFADRFPAGSNVNDVLERLGPCPAYDVWCCWNEIHRFGRALGRPA